MDSAVLDAYGWTGLKPPATSSSTTRTSDRCRRHPHWAAAAAAPWRYRWPDELRNEVLARLLKLNASAPNKSAAPAPEPRSVLRAPRNDAPRKATQPAGGQHLPGMEAETEEPS